MVILIVCIAFILWEKEISFFLYKNKDFCGIVLPSQEDLILKFNQYMKSDKMPCIIYADLESLMKKIDGYANSLQKSLYQQKQVNIFGADIQCHLHGHLII